MKNYLLITCLLASLTSINAAEAATICTIIIDNESSEVLHDEGDCDSRVTPASTFKLSLALMGYDAGILQDAHTPRLPFRQGYADWGGENWQQATDPERWMKYSVVWFSRQITPALGVKRLKDYSKAFGYGNADFSGDFAQSNALERAWMTSSLKISPREQVGFLSRMINYELPVAASAVDATREIVEFNDTPGGWRVWGKTGAAYPRQDTGSFDYSRGWGWFVGWAERDGTTLVFARLVQDETRHSVSPGRRTRAKILDEFDDLVSQVLP